MINCTDLNATKGLKVKFFDTVLSELGKEMFKSEEEEVQEDQEDEEEEEEKANGVDNSISHNSSIHANEDLIILNNNLPKPSKIVVSDFEKSNKVNRNSAHPSTHAGKSTRYTPISPNSKVSNKNSKDLKQSKVDDTKSINSKMESSNINLQSPSKKDIDKVSQWSKGESVNPEFGQK